MISRSAVQIHHAVHRCNNKIVFQQVRHAGHNKWSKIKHLKAANDLQRGKVYSKLQRQIIAAIKHGNGETDPNNNFYLSAAINQARLAKMPKLNIERAIQSAKSSAGGGDTEISYEVIAPGGQVACIVDCLTDNNRRTHQDLQTFLKKNGGAYTGTAYLFQWVGVIQFLPKDGETVDDALERVVMDVDVHDVYEMEEKDKCDLDPSLFSQLSIPNINIDPSNPETLATVPILESIVTFTDLLQTTQTLKQLGYTILTNEGRYVPKEKVELSEEEKDALGEWLEKAEELDDVVRVWHNGRL